MCLCDAWCLSQTKPAIRDGIGGCIFSDSKGVTEQPHNCNCLQESGHACHVGLFGADARSPRSNETRIVATRFPCHRRAEVALCRRLALTLHAPAPVPSVTGRKGEGDAARGANNFLKFANTGCSGAGGLREPRAPERRQGPRRNGNNSSGKPATEAPRETCQLGLLCCPFFAA
jgi:hypothetical protein